MSNRNAETIVESSIVVGATIVFVFHKNPDVALPIVPIVAGVSIVARTIVPDANVAIASILPFRKRAQFFSSTVTRSST